MSLGSRCPHSTSAAAEGQAERSAGRMRSRHVSALSKAAGLRTIRRGFAAKRWLAEEPLSEWTVLDYEIGRCSRRCAESGEEFKPGESFYSVLLPAGAEIVRKDYREQAWNGPPEGCIGSWKSVMPDPNAKRVEWAPNDVILEFFVELENQPQKSDTRYVLTLLMVRRHLLRLEDSEQEGDQEVMVLYCPRNETEYRVPVVTPTPDRVQAIQSELERLLFSAVQ